MVVSRVSRSKNPLCRIRRQGDTGLGFCFICRMPSFHMTGTGARISSAAGISRKYFQPPAVFRGIKIRVKNRSAKPMITLTVPIFFC